MTVRFIPDETKIDFVKYRRFTTPLSSLLVLLSILIICFRGIYLGIDFTGGIIIETRSQQKSSMEDLNNKLNSYGFRGFTIQSFDDSHDTMIRLKSESDKEQSAVVTEVKKILEDSLGNDIIYRKIDFVGPQVGSKQVLEGLLSVICSLVAMFFYLWMRFNWQFGLGGVLALVHDTILTLGFISCTAIEFNLSSTAALLTIIGYSVNDSVVIYDRIRESLRKLKTKKLSEIMNMSINDTLSRTILTSGTTLLATIPLIVFCKGTVRDFSLIIFIGILVGTYSSIFIAAPVLLNEKLKLKK